MIICENFQTWEMSSQLISGKTTLELEVVGRKLLRIQDDYGTSCSFGAGIRYICIGKFIKLEPEYKILHCFWLNYKNYKLLLYILFYIKIAARELKDRVFFAFCFHQFFLLTISSSPLPFTSSLPPSYALFFPCDFSFAFWVNFHGLKSLKLWFFVVAT